MLPVCEKYKQLQQTINKDESIIALSVEFERAKKKYEAVMEYPSKYHPDYDQATTELIKAKTNLFEDQTVSEFKNCEKEIQGIFNQITQLMRDMIKFQRGSHGTKQNPTNCLHR